LSKLGDIWAVYSRATDRLAFAIHADVQPPNGSFEGSIALAKELEVPSNVKTGGVSQGIVYLLFPNSGDGRPKKPDEIQKLGQALLEQWGGLQKLKNSTAE